MALASASVWVWCQEYIASTIYSVHDKQNQIHSKSVHSTSRRRTGPKAESNLQTVKATVSAQLVIVSAMALARVLLAMVSAALVISLANLLVKVLLVMAWGHLRTMLLESHMIHTSLAKHHTTNPKQLDYYTYHRRRFCLERTSSKNQPLAPMGSMMGLAWELLELLSWSKEIGSDWAWELMERVLVAARVKRWSKKQTWPEATP